MDRAVTPIKEKTEPSTIHSCANCEHIWVCRHITDNTDMDASNDCSNFSYFTTIEERRKKRILELVNAHGGIEHLVALDQLAINGDLFIPQQYANGIKELEKLNACPTSFSIE